MVPKMRLRQNQYVVEVRVGLPLDANPKIKKFLHQAHDFDPEEDIFPPLEVIAAVRNVERQAPFYLLVTVDETGAKTVELLPNQ